MTKATVLSSGNLILIAITPADSAGIFAMYNHPQIIAACGTRVMDNEAAAPAFIERITEGNNLVWTIRQLPDTRSLIGDCALHHYNPTEKSMEIGGTLLPDYWRKGIMQSAFAAIMEYAEEVLGIRTLIGKTRVDNAAAISLVESLGFKKSAIHGEELELIRHF